MGKASRRKAQQERTPKDPASQPAPYERRPFAGLPGETEWVAMREILPAATAQITYQHGDVSGTATLATVLPLAWPALRRDNEDILVALQAGAGTGDLSRDIAEALLAALSAEPGAAVDGQIRVSAASPRLQDLLQGQEPLRAEVHEGFDFWVEGAELDADSRESLERANEAAAPTFRLDGVPGADSAFWCRIGDRTYVRWILPHDEDRATDALARLHAAGADRLGDGRLLGAFRACGLLVPVWEVAADAEPQTFVEPFSELVSRFEEALAADTPLTVEERRARNGVVSRQVTLR